MFSTLEYMIDASMAEILEDIPIVEEVKTALVTREGKRMKDVFSSSSDEFSLSSKLSR